MSVSCGCMEMWLVFLMLILLTRLYQRGSLVSRGGQWADHVCHGCSRLISISRKWGWARHLPAWPIPIWSDGGPWCTSGKWTQQCAALVHAPIPHLQSFIPLFSCLWNKLALSLQSHPSLQVFKTAFHPHLISVPIQNL